MNITQPYYNNMIFYPRKSISCYDFSFATVCLVYFKLFIPIVIVIFKLAQHRDLVPTDNVFMISHVCALVHIKCNLCDALVKILPCLHARGFSRFYRS